MKFSLWWRHKTTSSSTRKIEPPDQGATRNKFCWLRNCSIAKLLVAFLLSLLLLFCSCCFFARKVCCFFAGCCFFADDLVLLFCFVASLLGTLHCFFALLLCCCCFFACVAFLLSKNLLSNKATQAKKQLSKQWVAFLLRKFVAFLLIAKTKVKI